MASWEKSLKLGRTYMLVSCQWFGTHLPVDNTSLLLPKQISLLKPRLVEGFDFVPVSEETWLKIIELYGGGPAIPRQASIFENGIARLDAYPIVLHVGVSQSSIRWPNEHPHIFFISRANQLRQIPDIVNQSITHESQEECRTDTSIFKMYLGMYGSDFTEVRLDHDESLRSVGDSTNILNGDSALRILFVKPPSTSKRTHDSAFLPVDVITSSKPFDEVPKELPINSGNQTGSIALGVCGLANVGNTCYMNAVLQSLLQTQQFVKYFVEEHKISSYVVRKNVSGFSVSIAFHDIVKLMWSNKHSIVVPAMFKIIAGACCKKFANADQQDAHEFLYFLLGAIHDELNTGKPAVEYDEDSFMMESPKSDQSFIGFENMEFDASDARMIAKQHDDSFLLDIFQGLQLSSLHCGACSFSSKTFESYTSLTLPISGGSLEECITHFTTAEQLGEQDMWFCPRCEEHRPATKKISLIASQVPRVLVIHLRRFNANGEKVQTVVEFPVSQFHLNCEGTSPSYSLVSIIRHHGSSVSRGHYTCVSKCSDMTWREMDDSSVTTCAPDGSDPDAYILFYKLMNE